MDTSPSWAKITLLLCAAGLLQTSCTRRTEPAYAYFSAHPVPPSQQTSRAAGRPDPARSKHERQETRTAATSDMSKAEKVRLFREFEAWENRRTVSGGPPADQTQP